MTGYSGVRYDDQQHKAAPRSHFSFVGRARRAARALTTVASALALAAGVLALVPAPAHADGAVPSQEYFSYYHFDTARAKGYTGKGVTIALIDGPVDTSNPALKGANITDKSRCTIQDSPEGIRHGTDMAIILVSPISGVAPDATLYTYQSSTAGTISNGSCDSKKGELNTTAALINQAVEDGAQFISISQSVSEVSFELKWAITNAMTKGVIIVASAGNEALQDDITALGRYSGVVGVSAINSDGTFASYSNSANGMVTAAFGGPYNTYDVNTGEPVTVHGTSISAPLVAGMLALARQKWPDATANQILQLLVHTGLNPNHDWNKYTGYGAIDGGALVNTDPSQYPDENPIIQKPGGSEPTAQDVQDYIDGVAGSLQIASFPDTYVYRGTNEAAIHLRGAQTVHLGTSPRYHRK
ncbi:S8 family peptidase [Actinomyces sp. S6-Spd3]|uniref:S8 family peptidase n=1 Tax=Actinomyces sp. S6-Spd3 TaxID=1284680 RepID=UPI00068F8358|nr:S8 family serine peptidase [Actinomyces sp. S6-Spd3]